MSYRKYIRPVARAGFVERDATLPDGAVIHYAEGGIGEVPLILIHGQTGAWQDYAAVLPELAKYYRVYAVDCYGHGGSCKRPTKYTAKAICEDLNWFMVRVTGAPAVISGHSSGGLIAAYMAANYPSAIMGAVLEDPPFFSTEQGTRWEKSFAYVDTYAPMHRFLNQTEETDWVMYYLKNCAWGKMVGEKGMKKMIAYGGKYRARHPGKPLNYFFLPDSINHMFWFLDKYDLRFGDAFYDGSWFDDYDQEKALSKIKCPAILIHTKWSVNDDGVLMAAMSGDDAKRACGLIENCELLKIESGHDSHFEKPGEFMRAFGLLREMMKRAKRN